MLEVPTFIKENCPKCYPRSYELIKCEFIGEKIKVDEADGEYEYLYQCCQCGEKIWVGTQWANEHAVDINI